ncbi:MAG TPA: DNA-binding response regulator, partial [Chitinophagaceae bacterium]|nr:DNA-binding response regulator [Chitinophagaceae bacterium]
TTVDTHRKNLLAKFEAKNTASLVRIASQLHLI